MAEPTVQVPVSLIERTAAEYEREGWPLAAEKWRALLSQPTPTAEPKTRQQRVQEVIDRNERNRLRSTPPSIADMVPGTTFVEDVLWTVTGTLSSGVVVAHSESGEMRFADRFDPSTIRDVTPPSTESTK